MYLNRRIFITGFLGNKWWDSSTVIRSAETSIDMKELLNRDSGVLIRSLMRATVPWRSTFVYAVMVCLLLLPHALTLWVFSFIFSGLLCLPLQSIWLLCHDDQYHGACPHLLRNYAATRHVSVTLHSSVENVQSDAVSQVFNWKSLKSLFLVAGASCVAQAAE